MFALGIHSVEKKQSVFVLRGGEIVARHAWTGDYDETEKLLVAIQAVLKQAACGFNDLKKIFVVSGPGGFSSTRIGVTVANTLAFALRIPVYGVPLTEGHAAENMIKKQSARSVQPRNRFVKPIYNTPPSITMKPQ